MVYITQQQYDEYLILKNRLERNKISKRKYLNSDRGKEKARQAMQRYRAKKRASPP